MDKSLSATLSSGFRRAMTSWQLYTLLIPVVVYACIFHYWPMYGMQIAFKEYRTNLGIWGSEWTGFMHFYRFITYPDFSRILGNTVMISLWSISTFPLSVILALLLNELGNAPFKKTVQMVSYAPHFVSTVVVCSMVTLFLRKDTGIFNLLVSSLGGQQIDYLTQPKYFISIYVVSGVWQGIGWGAIVYLAALSSVSQELSEAAYIDGASRLQIILHVNLPTIMPTIVTMLIMRCGSVLSVGFEKIFLLQNSLNQDVSRVISTYVYEIGIIGGQFSYSTAIGLFNNVANILLLLLVNAIARRVSESALW